MPLQFENILYESADGVAWITLNRPEALNAFADEMRDELLQALLAAQEDDAVRAIVLTGAGRAFCAGGDVRYMASLKGDEAGFEKVRPLMDAGRRVVTVIHEMPKPVVAMINGVAAGAGCNLALACDLRVASEEASFTESFVGLGLHPDWGGTFFLPRLVGTGRALQLMLTGQKIDATQAQQMGLVQQVVPAAALRELTQRLAQQLAAAPPTAVRLIKLAVYNSAHYDLDSMLEFEVEAQAQCWDSSDSAEGIAAFVQKRPPDFVGVARRARAKVAREAEQQADATDD